MNRNCLFEGSIPQEWTVSIRTTHAVNAEQGMFHLRRNPAIGVSWTVCSGSIAFVCSRIIQAVLRLVRFSVILSVL